MATAMRTVTIGGKGSNLTSSSVYSIANGLCQVNIDSSTLDHKLISSDSNSKRTSLKNISSPIFLTLIEARASLVVLLQKLIITQQGIRSVLPKLIRDTLNGSERPLLAESLDFGSALGFLNSLCKVNGKSIEDVGVTDAELTVLEESCYVLDGICALLDWCSSSLSTVADAVAALSCEASNADVSALVESLDSGDGYADKDMVAVSKDFKALLSGSKLVGKNQSKVVSLIPEVHGSFREIVKQVRSTLRVKLNSSVGIRVLKDGCSLISNVRGGTQLVKTIRSLAESLIHLGESSLCRMELVGTKCQDADICSKVLETSKAFKKRVCLSSEANYVRLFHEINSLVATVRTILAWEGALAILSLDSMEKAQDNPSSSVETTDGEKKSRKKKKVVLGKGTAVLKQLLKDRLKSEGGEDTVEKFAALTEWARDLCLFFEPKDPEIDTFVEKVKEMVEDTVGLLKFPKGTRDFAKEQKAFRDKVFEIIKAVFKRYGAEALETPAFELREILRGKYGEDSKLIYDLADQGGELCSLRYDLTVPFARYVAMNGLTSCKRWQIDPVWRRDNTAKGRSRQFYQCDFDIAGKFETMGPDFEVVKVLTDLLDELNISDYEIKLSHRKLLDGMLEICGVPPEKFRTICSTIDKLDKLGEEKFEKIKTEMVEEKGVTAEVADKIITLVQKRGHPLELLSELKQDNRFLENNGSSVALKELEILFDAFERSKCIDRVVFDLSLARGLDYYTGVIFEAVSKGTTDVGSIAAGGRYDNLIGMFGTRQVPSVGVSLGIERVLLIMEQQKLDKSIRATETDVLVSILGDSLGEAAELVSEIRSAKISAEFSVDKRIKKQIQRANDSKIPFMVIVGDEERRTNQVRIKELLAKKEDLVDRDSVVEELQRRLKTTTNPC